MEIIGMAAGIAKALPTLIKVANKYRNKKRKNILEREIDQKAVFLNLSGHTLSREALAKLKTWGDLHIVDKKIPSINIPTIVEDTTKIIIDLIENERIIHPLLTGRYYLYPPGFAPLSLVLVTMLHGVSGHFPTIVLSQRGDMVYEIVDKLSLQAIRDEFREMR